MRWRRASAVMLMCAAAVMTGCAREPNIVYADSSALTHFYSGPGKLGMRDVVALRCFPDEEKGVVYLVCSARFRGLTPPAGQHEFRWSLRRHAREPAFGFYVIRTEEGGYRVGVDAALKGLSVARQIATVEDAMTRTRAASESAVQVVPPAPVASAAEQGQ